MRKSISCGGNSKHQDPRLRPWVVLEPKVIVGEGKSELRKGGLGRSYSVFYIIKSGSSFILITVRSH